MRSLYVAREPRWLQARAIQGNIAVYSTPVSYVNGGTPRGSTIHAGVS
jgi:hypothetical protein